MYVFITFIIISLLPFLFLITRSDVPGDMILTLGNSAGFMGATLIIWQYILGIRSLAEKLFGQQAFRVKLHMLVGIYGMFFLLIHPFFVMISYGEKLSFVLFPSLANDIELYISAGRVAFVFILFIWVTSAIIRNKLSYTVWLRFHYLSYPLMALVFLHAIKIGTFLRTFPLIRLYFFILMGVYIIILIWKTLEVISMKKNSSQKQKAP